MHVVQFNCSYRADLDTSDYLASVPTLTRTCEALARAGCKVSVLQRFSRDEDRTANGVEYCFRRDWATRAFARPWTVPAALLQQARARAADIVHVNGLIFPAQVAMLRAALSRKTRIVIQHHGEMPAPGKLLLLQRVCLRLANGFIFNGAGNADAWRAAGVIRSGQAVCEAIEGSCDFTPMPHDEARRMTGVTGAPAILWVGRLHPRKDPLTALAGFLVAASRLPAARLFMIYNDETLLSALHDQLAHAGEAGQRVHLIGKVAHDATSNLASDQGQAPLAAWYSAADLFITSSPAEGSNYALIESLSCGATPVCSDIHPHRFIAGGLAEYWPLGNTMACVDAIARAFSRASDAQRSIVRQHFDARLTWDAIAQQLLDAYQHMTNRPHAYC